MPTLIPAPVRVEAAGDKPTLIDEHVGRAASGHTAVRVAHVAVCRPALAPEPAHRDPA